MAFFAVRSILNFFARSHCQPACFITRFCNVYFLQKGKKGKICDNASRGYFTTIMHLRKLAIKIRKVLAEKSTIVLESPLYLLNLAPCDFFFHPKVKSTIRNTFSKHGCHQKLPTTRASRDSPRIVLEVH